jgi:ferrous iron transport protein B
MMLFMLVGTPCMATVAVTRRESGSWRWALLQFGALTAVAYVLTTLVFQAGRLMGF